MNPDTTPTPFFPKHEAALASKSHAARRPSGVKAMANGLWESEWGEPKAISDNFFLAHESLIIAADQMDKLERELAEKTNDANNWHQHYRDEASKAQKLKQAFIALSKVAQAVVERWDTPSWKDVEPTASVMNRLREALAPAPEELVSEGTRIASEARSVCNNLTDAERAKAREKANEVMVWRDLGQDEVICEGDETNQRGSYDWGLCSKYFIGRQVWEFIPFHPLRSFRTRRPLPPVVDQSKSKWFKDGAKQEEMPLEKAPDALHAWMRLQEHINREVAVDLQRLFDEIQTLKAKKSQSPNLS